MALASWIQTNLIETGIGYGAGLSLVLGIILQVSFQWPAMIIVGALAGLFVKRHRHAFIAGFWGVALAWCALFVIHVELFHAYEIGEFFASLIGAPGLGRFIVSLSILLGGMLGGLGALVGYCVVDLAQEYRSHHSKEENI
ncbi:MAG: hypothetical protein RTV72_08170 [Candidatus Thorarchaeota archaeon]